MILGAATQFQWDNGNSAKNQIKHGVLKEECEEIFFNEPLLITSDEKHSLNEERYFALGVTDFGNYLFVVFTIRGTKIRVISARSMNRKERKIYDEKVTDL